MVWTLFPKKLVSWRVLITKALSKSFGVLRMAHSVGIVSIRNIFLKVMKYELGVSKRKEFWLVK